MVKSFIQLTSKFVTSINKRITLFHIELVLLGILFCGVAVFAVQLEIDDGEGWGILRIFLLVLGICCLVLCCGLGMLELLAVIDNRFTKYFGEYLNKVIAYCLLCLMFFEVLTRVTIYGPPVISENFNVRKAPAENSIVVFGKEGYAFTQYKKFGEIATPYDGNKYILLLGDSHTEALQVPDDKKFASVAEFQLHKWDENLNVLNFGLSGLSVADYVSMIPLYIDAYQPSVIVVQVTSNDFVESLSTQKSNYFIQSNGKIIGLEQRVNLAGESVVSNSNKSLNISSVLVSLVSERAENLWRPPAEMGVEIGFDVQLAEQQLNELINVCQGTPLVLILLPHSPSISAGQFVTSEPEYEKLITVIQRFPNIIFVEPHQKFLELAKNGSLPRGFFNSTMPGKGHLNIKGNKIVGELLAEAIEKALQ